MTLFVILAVLLVAAALALLLPPLLGFGRRRDAAREAINVALFHDRRNELAQELETGTITEEQFAAAELELERDLLLNAEAESGSVARAGRMLAVVVALAVPVLAGGLYWYLGSPDFVNAPANGAAEAGNNSKAMANMEQLIAQLRDHLKAQPDDAQGWALLGRSYAVQQRYGEAAGAFAEAVKLVGNDPELLTEYAEALALQHGSIRGQPMQLVEKALTLSPNEQGALWMAGVGAFEEHNYRAAVSYWERLLALVPPDGEGTQTLRDNIAEARARLGEPLPAQKTQPSAPVAKGAAIQVEVSLAPALAAQAKPDDIVFVLARSPQGGMPLAAVRRQVRDLPTTITLDDSTAPMAGQSLADFKELQVVARVSRSGGVMAQSGDFEGSVAASVGGKTAYKLVIDKVHP